MTQERHLWQIRGQVLDLGGRPLVMGIVNVTPDSFSDGGRFAAPQEALEHGLRLVEQGADLLDVGGESSRPGAQPVELAVELERVVPVVEKLAARAGVPISVDTCKAEVARQCLEAGASIVNDITALASDERMAEVIAASGAGVILMHMQGTPATMQAAPNYQNVVKEVQEFLQVRLQESAKRGIAPLQTVLDPGIGFGKKAAHNLELLASLTCLQELGRPIALGVSRKGLLGKLLDRPVERRLAGSLAVVCDAFKQGGAQIFRVHDVEETRDVLTTLEAIERHRR